MPDPILISLNDYVTASGKYIDRLASTDLTEEVKTNAAALLYKVNALLVELGLEKATVSSGFRPASVNSATTGGAKRSLHLSGKAVDISDPTHSLYKLIEAKPELLMKYSLWMEHKDNAPTWVHLDIGTRSARAIRIFRA